MKTKLYLDTRGIKEGSEAPIKIAMNNHGSSVYISTNIKVLPSQWDKEFGKVIGHPLRNNYNLSLQTKKVEVDNAIETLRKKGVLSGKSLSEIRAEVLHFLYPEENAIEKPTLFMARFDSWTSSRPKEATRVSYGVTAVKIRAFEPKADSMKFEDVTVLWVSSFDTYLEEAGLAKNTRNIHLRNIRTVVNNAIDEGITQTYAFRKFKIRPEPTKDRSISKEKLQELFRYPCEPAQEEYRDIFKLIIMLCGINMADLVAVKDIPQGRIERLRIKTGQPLSIAVVPPAMAIINKYKGIDHLLNIGDRYADYRDYAHKLNDNVKRIGKHYNPHTKKWEGEAICPEASVYWARYSFATIAAELDVPEKTIAAALGHSTSGSVTSIYTRNEMRHKVDEAQRKVIDYLFGDEDILPE